VGVEVRDKLIGHGVGNDIHTFENRDAVSHFTHDDRDRGVERVSNGRENLAARFFLPTLYLAQVAECDGCATRNLPEGATLLQAEVTKHVTDFLTNQDHVNPPPHFYFCTTLVAVGCVMLHPSGRSL